MELQTRLTKLCGRALRGSPWSCARLGLLLELAGRLCLRYCMPTCLSICTITICDLAEMPVTLFAFQRANVLRCLRFSGRARYIVYSSAAPSKTLDVNQRPNPLFAIEKVRLRSRCRYACCACRCHCAQLLVHNKRFFSAQLSSNAAILDLVAVAPRPRAALSPKPRRGDRSAQSPVVRRPRPQRRPQPPESRSPR